MTWHIEPAQFISRPLPLAIAAERGPFIANAQSGERLIVTLYATPPRMRGFLAEAIFDAVEQTLREQGAPAVDRMVTRDFSDGLMDAIYRAGLLGASGLALELEDLSGIADSDNTLHSEDSQTLARWIEATEQHAVQLLLPPAVRALKIFPEPVTVASILPLSASLKLPAVIEYGASDASAMTESHSDEDDDAIPPSLFPPSLDAFAELESPQDASTDSLESLIQQATDAKADAHASAPQLDLAEADTSEFEIPQSVHAEAQREPLESEPLDADAGEDIDDGWAPAVLSEPPPVEPVVAMEVASAVVAAQPVSAPQPAAVAPGAAPKSIAAETFVHVRELEATCGPKPLSVIERLYSTAFIPLQRAVNLGQAPANAAALLEEWSHSFAKSYKEAFEALKGRGRRPAMVMDLPEMAHRLSRLHGTRNVQLLLVDAMSYDLGQRIDHRLQHLLTQRAACAERMMLWSGLPATTATQLELLGRGQNALREFTGEIDDEMVVNRGRMANTIRRIRTGHRELYKLDLVEAMLVGAGAPVEERLEEIADAVAPVLANHITQQPHGTLVMIFGDHGFRFEQDEHGNTTQVATTSARVEEVLTPAFAWLTGSLH